MSQTPINLPYGSGEAANGSQLALLNLASPAVYQLIGNVGNEDWALSIKDAETSNQGLPWTQGIPCIVDGGDFTFDLMLVPSSVGNEESASAGLEGHGFETGLGWVATQRQTRQWKLTWPDGTGIYFSAYFTKFPVSMPVDKALTAKCALKITGAVTPFGGG